jgi:hypothetical protein
MLNGLARTCFLSFAVLSLPAAGQEPPPDPAVRATIIARVSENALAWLDHLPDFVCTQVSRRSTDKSGSGKRFHLDETVVEEVGYSAGRESYKVVTRNGKPTGLTHRQVMRGYGSSGEFGSHLRWVFDPQHQAEFEWDRWDTLQGRRVWVFRFRVPESRHTWVATVNGQQYKLPYFGSVYADCETASVMRVQFTTTAPADAPISNVSLDLQYGFVSISGRQYVLPVRAEERSTYHSAALKKEIDFSNYHKYTADSSLKFDQ